MNRKILWNTILTLILLLSLLGGVTLAQEPEPPPHDPDGVLAAGQNAASAAAFSGGPDYDSGWISIGQDEVKTLTHNLGGSTDNYVVDMQYQNSGSGINQRYYGGAGFGANLSGKEDNRVGAYWRSLTTSSIAVYRRMEDTYAEQIRIRIWVDSSPDYDSDWVSLTAGAAATTLTHSLGGSADDYVVDMQYKYGSTVNQRYYGGADFGANVSGKEDNRVGAYWRSLTTSSIAVYRRAEDTYAEQVRIRIWVRPTPTYDSGWVSINQDQAQTFTHNIGGNADDYVVDMQYQNSGSGINQRYYGGADFGANVSGKEDDRVGAYWRSLTTSSITVFRRAEDTYAEQVRIRIWHSWRPPVPGYDSGWTAIGQAQALQFSHNLGGDPDDYLVNLSFQDDNTFNGINHRSFGGHDYGANASAKEDNRYGVYWRQLTGTAIYVYRRAEDTYAEQVRIRIWVMPAPAYDSNWTATSPGSVSIFTHNLGGDPDDYLIDLSFQDGDSFNGINQRSYGGQDYGAQAGGKEDDSYGVYWYSLNGTSLRVYRRIEDTYADQVRVRIWFMAAPDYDSTWTAINTDQALQFLHNQGGNENSYLVDLSFKDASYEINQIGYGGMDLVNDNRWGAYWRHLTGTDIYVYRRAEDAYADEVRVRIWDTMPYRLYLPLVVRNP